MSAINSITVQPDGKLLIAGTTVDPDSTFGNGIMRINLDGTIDTNFNP